MTSFRSDRRCSPNGFRRGVCRRAQEVAMIKDVMVWLDGGISDDIRLAAAADIARQLDSQVIIGLFLVLLPLPGPADAAISGTLATAELLNLAREAGDKTEALLAKRLRQLDRPVEIRRFDILGRRRRPCCRPRGALRRYLRRAASQWRNGSRAAGRRRSFRIGPEYLSGSRDRAAQDRLRSYPYRLERQPGVGPSRGRSHAVSAPRK